MEPRTDAVSCAPTLGRRSTLLAGVLVLAALAPARAGGDCRVEADPLLPLEEALAAALDAAPDRATRRRLDAGRRALDGVEEEFVDRVAAFARAARKVEPVPDAALADALGEVLAALRTELVGERERLEAAVGATATSVQVRAKLDALEDDAAFHDAAGRRARAAVALGRAARLLHRIEFPPAITYGGPLRVVTFNREGADYVPLNAPLALTFSAPVDPASVRFDTVVVRGGPNFATQVPGTLHVRGNTVTFVPSLPGSSDGAAGGFEAGRRYRVTAPGHPSTSTVRGRTGKPLSATYVSEFSTALGWPDLWNAAYYGEAPPPRVTCTEPLDVPPSFPFDGPAGATGVPTDTAPVLRFRNVPLDPATVQGDGVALWMTDLRGVPVRRRIEGTVELRQDADGVSVTFRPAARLPDRSRFVVQCDHGVTDVSGAWRLPAHEERAAQRQRATAQPGAERALAEAHPMETDPRTFLVFTTADEPESLEAARLEFDGSDRDVSGGDGVDADRTSAVVDRSGGGRVIARSTAVGGDGRDGVFAPTADVTLDTDTPGAADGSFHFQRVHVPAGVTVRFTGSRPAVIRAVESIVIEGVVDVSGGAGEHSAGLTPSSLPLTTQKGGVPGPGGGVGGTPFRELPWLPGYADGGAGFSGGGGGGTGGEELPESVASISLPGGGGGGGGAARGSDGQKSTLVNNSVPGLLGQATPGRGGDPIEGEPSSARTTGGRDFAGFGGGGGGAGGNMRYGLYSGPVWQSTFAGAGGGGSGGLLALLCDGPIRLAGTLRAVGGAGGDTHPTILTWTAAPGGGGAGGTVVVCSATEVDATGGFIDVTGGRAGLAHGYAGLAGAGSPGVARIEDADGLPRGVTFRTVSHDFTVGTFEFPASVAADAPSVFTSRWFDLGALDVEFLPLGPSDFAETSIPGAAITWELQFAADDALAPAAPAPGEEPAAGLGTPWIVVKDADGIHDDPDARNGLGLRYFRLRIGFELPVGTLPGDAMPAVEAFTLPYRLP